MIIFFVIVFFGSCTKQEAQLDNETLARIIADMHIAEVAIQRNESGITDSLQMIYLEKLSKIHEVEKDDIKREVELLMDDRKRQSDVYGLVVKRLQKIEKDIKYLKDKKDFLPKDKG